MSSSKWDQLGHRLAWVLRIKPDQAGKQQHVSRGESVYSISSADTYVEQEPTSLEWIQEQIPSRQGVFNYLLSLIPFVSWIGRYNFVWLTGDLIAGITIGAVVVPQGMAYAKLAELPVEFGLYTAFMGVLIYWFFATSKDITIGPVAVLSTVTGNVVLRAQKDIPHVPGYQVAEALAIIAGSIVCFLGLVRLGWIVDFISLTSVTSFITGSAINIGVGQIPTLMGIAGVNNRQATYLVVIGILKHLGQTRLDAALGFTALFMLYLIRFVCNWGTKRFPRYTKAFFFANTLRTVFVILLYTLISWASQNSRAQHNYKKAQWKILGPVPRGFKYAHVPVVNKEIIKSFADELPSTVIVMLIEHIAIAKSFGRINNYVINPSQELLAIGISNLLGPFLGAYPATGSFSRTAIKSKAAVRTPLAGVITAIVVLLAIYALPAVFFWIPSAALAAVIIHAVFDLITPPNTLYQFWRISPLEVIIWLAGVLVTVFSSIENGVYVTVSVSAALLLWRVAKARGRFLGRATVHSVIGDHLLDGPNPEKDQNQPAQSQSQSQSQSAIRRAPRGDENDSTRPIFLPINHQDGSNPNLELTSPYPGVFIYRFSEGYNYPNASHYLDFMVHTIFKETRRTNSASFPRVGDRPWNDAGPKKGHEGDVDMSLPTLKAVILDFSSVNNVDVTSVQTLVDVRNQLDRYTSPEKVQWHFACINNRWSKRALASAGFGYPTAQGQDNSFQRWKPIFSVAEIGGSDSAAAAADAYENERRRKESAVADEELAINRVGSASRNQVTSEYNQYVSQNKVAVVQGVNRPLFHIDVTNALRSAIAGIENEANPGNGNESPADDMSLNGHLITRERERAGKVE